MTLDPDNTRKLALAVIETEARAVADLADRIDATFLAACEHILACRGRVVVTGMGKSGHIGGKLAATFASTGTPAFFVHPGEASHGDLGMITRDDVAIALSHSGETDEILTILPLIRRLGVPLIALTGNPGSRLATEATVHLDISVEREACPLGLAPTSSTTATLAMGDALAVAVLDARGFTADDFARSHPGGRLGRRLLIHVGDIMRTGDAIPRIHAGALLRDALLEVSRKGLGMVVICNDDGAIEGVFTDGDLRRTLDRGLDLHRLTVGEVMTRNGCTARPDWLAAEALQIMESRRINALPVIDDERQRLVGAINMHDLLRAGVA
ncbi:Arabinose 5-phosphate isomerase [Thioalkalivibrio nitratireducens DSM 14787]|uniref:Arabinose 5-phosphate isomerase n=1 Tax=Thioalkalivibrio nitratireducens (strain DSM 14787 / UNIQEM 213 / ALEN2) TaxID=1255043 RepID=L0DZ03_THIND|nr:KpsF/GutQ family sugar-phosphate isomerase [Thioalkalivibrio nitratireducens]AGA34278.1 Arabinose 5-phosphate isomerase [Thioalkalivibrio nitratireducens DSM 14787]